MGKTGEDDRSRDVPTYISKDYGDMRQRMKSKRQRRFIISLFTFWFLLSRFLAIIFHADTMRVRRNALVYIL